MASVDTVETVMYVGTSRIVVNNLDLLTPVDTAGTVMDGGDTAVMDGGDMAVKSTAVETTCVEPAMESAGVESAAVEAAAVPSASPSVGEIWLAENSRAQQRSCNAHHSPRLLGDGFVIA